MPVVWEWVAADVSVIIANKRVSIAVEFLKKAFWPVRIKGRPFYFGGGLIYAHPKREYKGCKIGADYL